MKEATGELNMTVITVVAIAAVGMLFTIFVWPNIQSNLALNTACSQVDANGNYTTAAGALGPGGGAAGGGAAGGGAAGGGAAAAADGTITCAAFTCTATYNGKTYSKQCTAS